MFRSVRWKLTASYIAIVGLTVLVVGFFLRSSLAAYTRNNLSAQLTAQARLAAQIAAAEMAGSGDVHALAEKLSPPTGARVTIVGRDGEVLGDSLPDNAVLENHGDRTEIISALAGGVGISYRLSETTREEMLYVAVPVSDGPKIAGALRLALPLTAVAEQSRRVGIALSSAGALAVLGIILLGSQLAASITRPLEAMTRAADKLARGDYPTQLVAGQNDEIGILSQAFNRMTERLEEKMAELSRVNAELSVIVANMGSGIMLLDDRGRIMRLNPFAAEIFGIEAEAGAGRHNLEVLKDYDLDQRIKTAQATGEAQTGEMHLLLPQERRLEIAVVPVGSGTASPLMVVVFREVTDAWRLARVRAELVSNVSHEMRTPLTSIKGFTETLIDGALSDPEQARRFIGIIDAEAERMARLIDDLLDLARIESGRSPFRFRKTDLGRVVAATAEKLQPQLARTGLLLTVDLPYALPLILADADRLAQVILNLVENSIKYTHRGGQITIRGETPPGAVCLSVTDNGVGIPAADLPRVFERFFRVDKTRARASGGTGLGLAIVKHIVEAHGGRVEVQSTVGVGSTFRLCLPMEGEKLTES